MVTGITNWMLTNVGLGTVIMSAMVLDSDTLLNIVARAYTELSLTALISLGFVIMGNQ